MWCIREPSCCTLDGTLQRTYDPYAFIRDAWLQQREFEIFDGNPPPETLEDLEEFEDEPPPPEEENARAVSARLAGRASSPTSSSAPLASHPRPFFSPPIRSSTSLMRASASICAGTLAKRIARPP